MVREFLFFGKGHTPSGADKDLDKKISSLEEKLGNLKRVRESKKKFIGIYVPDHDLLWYDSDDIHQFEGESWREVKLQAVFRLNLNYVPIYFVKQTIYYEDSE